MRKNLHAFVAVMIFALICVGGAGAKTLIDGGKDIKGKSVTGSRLKDKSVTCAKVKGNLAKLCTATNTLLAQTPAQARPGANGANGAQGQQGDQGQKGDKGEKGEKGDNGAPGPQGTANYVGPKWGVVDRNTIKSPVADLRSGPFVPGANGSPPFGDGSLSLVVGDNTEKASFGNEVDFQGKTVAGLTAVGYRVYTTGENSALATPNMPSITFEVNPNGAGGSTTAFSSLVWIPSANSASNQWSPYIDATTDGFWGLTGGQFNSPATAANCGLNGPRCTFAQVKTFLASGTGATIYTVQVTKGRDFAWQGAVDGLRINSTVFDFEPFGVREIAVP